MCTADINEKKFAMKTKNQKQKKVVELNKNTGKVGEEVYVELKMILHLE